MQCPLAPGRLCQADVLLPLIPQLASLQREGVIQGCAGSGHFLLTPFWAIFSTELLKCQDFSETRPPPLLAPHCVLSPENHMHLPFSSQRTLSLLVLSQLTGNPSSIFFCLAGSYSTSNSQILGHHFRAASLTLKPTLPCLPMFSPQSS